MTAGEKMVWAHAFAHGYGKRVGSYSSVEEMKQARTNASDEAWACVKGLRAAAADSAEARKESNPLEADLMLEEMTQ